MPSTNFELRRKLLQLEALYDVGRALSASRPENELLEEVVQRAIATLDATIGFIFSLDERLEIQQFYGFGLAQLGDPSTLLAEPPVREVIASREPISVTVSKFAGQAGSEMLLAPLVAGDTIVGVIGVGGKEERGSRSGSFAEDDLRFLSSLAAIGGAAVDNSRRFHRLDLAMP